MQAAMRVILRALRENDATAFEDAFSRIGWSKPAHLFYRYAEEQRHGNRWVGVAELGGNLAGYVTLLWASEDPAFRASSVPEIVDLNVLPAYRRQGIGAALLEAAESQAASRSGTVGIRVGLHAGYGAAQRIYVARGYLPDGTGALVGGVQVPEGAAITLDDNVTIRMTKSLTSD